MLSMITKHVLASASKAKLTTNYGYKQAIPHRTALEEMGHCQPHIIVTTNNMTEKGLMLATLQSKASKSINI